MVKRIMGLILTGTMIMSLLACGKADTDTAKTTQSDSNSSISSSSEDASNSEGDVIPLHLQSMLRILKIRHRRYMQ